MTFHDDDGSPARDSDELSAPAGASTATEHAPPIHVIVLRQVADALDTDPVDLPPLNSVIDPDALCVLARTTRWTDGDWPAVTFPYVDCVVTVTGPSSVSVHRVDRADRRRADGPGGRVRWPHTSPATDARTNSTGTLETRLVTALADVTEHDAARIREELDDVVDRSAIARLNRPRANGRERTGATVRFAALGRDVVVGPDGTIATGSTLERLRLTGSNVLQVGAVPDEITAHASAQFLGQRDGPHRRIFALLDRGVDAAIDRLSRLGEPSGGAHVIDRETLARSTAASRETTAGSEAGPTPDTRAGGDSEATPDAHADGDAEATPDDSADGDAEPTADAGADGVDSGRVDPVARSGTGDELTVETVGGDLDAFVDAVEAAVTGDPDDDRPGVDLRLCVDSLRPLVEARGAAETRALLEPICDRVAAASGVAHYVFPVERDAAPVRAIESLFDATVELRVGPAGPVQRWHLHDGRYATEWFALRRP